MHKYSLHIGLNSVNPSIYGGWNGELFGCENDAIAMRELLWEVFISRMMNTKRATRTNVLNQISQLAKFAMPEDVVYITYSGHGTQVADLNHDESDKLDEAWCLYDGLLIDDDISYALSEFKAGVVVYVISDSCTSGTITKSFENSLSELRPKFMPQIIESKIAVENKSAIKAIVPAIQKRPVANVITLSACQDGQVSYDSGTNGLFTSLLINALNMKYPNGQTKQKTLLELFGIIKDHSHKNSMPRLGYINGHEKLNSPLI